jgi:hypothetical protein
MRTLPAAPPRRPRGGPDCMLFATCWFRGPDQHYAEATSHAASRRPRTRSSLREIYYQRSTDDPPPTL